MFYGKLRYYKAVIDGLRSKWTGLLQRVGKLLAFRSATEVETFYRTRKQGKYNTILYFVMLQFIQIKKVFLINDELPKQPSCDGGRYYGDGGRTKTGLG